MNNTSDATQGILENRIRDLEKGAKIWSFVLWILVLANIGLMVLLHGIKNHSPEMGFNNAQLNDIEKRLSAMEKAIFPGKVTGKVDTQESASAAKSLPGDQGNQGMVYEQKKDGGIGEKIPSVQLTFVSEDGSKLQSTRSDDKGFYRTNLETGRYVVTAKHPDFETYSTAPGFTVIIGKGYQTANFFLKRKSDTIADAGADGGRLETVVGGAYGPYVVEEIVIAGAPPGNYTFTVESPTAGTVTLRRDGTPVRTFGYNWQTTVSATDSNLYYTFDFPGYLKVTIRKAVAGTMNLYAMDQSIFDGIHVLTVNNDGGEEPD